MFKYLFSMLLFASVLQAATITSQQNNYQVGQPIVLTVSGMAGDRDWIGIYPAGASNDWGNVVAWKWTGDVQNGKFTFNSAHTGNYEARAFFHNSYHTEATASFSVSSNQQNAGVVTSKSQYSINESVKVTVSNLPGNNNDWVAIYPANASNAWGNVVAWKFTHGVKNGVINLGKAPAGSYQVRVFFNNTFTLRASHNFTVVGAVNNTTITTSKQTYKTHEQVVATVGNMKGNNNDWVAIYPAGASNAWGNVVAWKYTNGIKNGNFGFGTLPVGNYEVRAFFNNSYNLEASSAFKVIAGGGGGGGGGGGNLPPTVYEDAENGLADWVKISGPSTPTVTSGNGHTAVRIQPHWVRLNDGRWTNDVSFLLWMNNNNQKVLSVDIGGDGRPMPHYQIGVRVTTTNGARRLLWSSFYTHEHIPATKRGSIMTFPSPVEQVRGFLGISANTWENFTVNVEDALHHFEPNNTILSVDYFYTTGGVLDNIMLKSN